MIFDSGWWIFFWFIRSAATWSLMTGDFLTRDFWPEIFWLETFDKRSALSWRHEGRFFDLKLLIWDQHGNENSSESFFLMTAIPFRWRRLMGLITFPKVRRKKNKINIMTGLAWYTDHVKGCHWQHEANCNIEKSLLSKCSVRPGAFPYSIK